MTKDRWPVQVAGILFTVLLIICNVESAADDDHGGWCAGDKYRKPTPATPGPCNVPVRDHTFTQEEFMKDFAFKAPVVVDMVTDNKAFQKAVQKERLLSDHGEKIIRLSSANTHSYKKVDVTLKKYVEEIMKPQTLDMLGNETFYWFGDNNFTEWKDIIDLYQPPPFKQPRLTGAYSFGVAGSGTGVPFHWHGPGWAEVIYGRKRWFLYPPEKTPTFNPDKTTLHWLVEDYPHLKTEDLPMECTIGPGQAIYFPDKWWHGTLNLDTSVFISTFLG